MNFLIPDKLTDEQIIKALECCMKGSCGCDGCPAANNDNNTCRLQRSDVLDLINRLKAKNKEFDEKIVIQMGTIDWQAKEINRQKAEIERLKAMHSEMCIGMKVLKRKAIKEFAERYRKEIFSITHFNGYVNSDLVLGIFNDLVKEMEGADK